MQGLGPMANMKTLQSKQLFLLGNNVDGWFGVFLCTPSWCYCYGEPGLDLVFDPFRAGGILCRSRRSIEGKIAEYGEGTAVMGQVVRSGNPIFAGILSYRTPSTSRVFFGHFLDQLFEPFLSHCQVVGR